ncbi:MAG: hypothetical protein LBC73_03330 [Oscillospiraceae bacterium]|jgi:hypothetical protein|nr:hypothetical protein [Oscillospiraceae bacterium]
MKIYKVIILTVVCLISVSVLFSILGVIVYSMLLQVISIPFISTESQMTFAATVDLLLFLLRILMFAIIGWVIATYISNNKTINWREGTIRFFKRNWMFLVLSMLFLWFLFDTSSIIFGVISNISVFIENLFNGYNILAPDQVRNHGVEYNLPVVFFQYLLINPVGYISLLFAFFTYRLRREISKLDKQKERLTPVEIT